MTEQSAPSDVDEPTEEILLGMGTLEGSSLGSTQDARMGAEAAVAYVNEDLDGVEGRPLKLVIRSTRATPESSIEAAHELVALNPVAFIGGADYFGFTSAGIYGASGIPVVGGPAFNEAEYTTPNTYKFAPSGSMNWPAMAVHAIDQLKAQRIAVLFPDNVPGNSAVDGVLEPTIKAKWGELIRVPYVASWTRDAYARTVQEALAASPDAVIVIGPAHACRGIVIALRSQARDIPLYSSTIAIAASVAEDIGEDAIVGLYSVSAFDSWGDGDETRAYRKAVRRYVYRDELDEMGVATFNGIMNLYAILKELAPGDISAGTIATALRSTKDMPSFMGHPYTCDGKQAPGRPAIGSPFTRVVQLQRGLRVAYISDWLDHSGLVPAP